MIPRVLAVSSPWTQTDWSGGSGQTAWSDATKYSSGSSVDATTTSGQVTLTTAEELSNTGFESNLTGWNTGAQPDSISGLQLWLKADAITGLNDGDSVTTWIDSSGNSNNATQSTAANKPTYKVNQINGSPTVRFDGNDVLGGSFSQSSQNTFFVVRDITSVSGQNGTTFSSSSVSGIRWALNMNNSGSQTAGWAGTSSNINLNQTYPTTWSLNTYYSQAYIKTSTYWNLFTNGTSASSNISDSSAPTATFSYAVGAEGTGGGYPMTGNIAEIIVFDTAFSNTSRQDIESYLQSKYGISSGYATLTRDTTTTYNSSAGAAKLVNGSSAQNFTQPVNVGDTNTYNLVAYAYTDGSAVTSSDVELFYNGSTISTAYTSVGSGWYKLTGTLTGANASRQYGVQVKANETVYVDNFSLNSYASSGTLTSSIFDTEYTAGAAWGTLTYTSSGSTVAVKARTSNSSSMTGATDFSSCIAITSGNDISSNSCVTDGHRYIQYQLAFSTSDTSLTPTFSDISIAYSAYDTTPPSISLTALSPDPNNDNTPALTGTATDAVGTVSNVQFQMDSTSGSWTACTADDGTFDEASEAFTCTVSSALSDGSHTMYVRSTDSNSNTTADVDAASDTFTIDTAIPTVSVTAISPDPGTDTTPTISGTATDTGGTISNVQFQVDSTSGSWSSCTASDGSFNSSSESFSCTTSALSDGSHTIYIRSVDNASNNSSNVSDSFTVDTTNPVSFDLDSPGNNSYTNSERPSFKWKATTDATAGLSKYVLEIDNPSIGSGQPSGDFTIDSIPTSRTTDYETNKYVIHYENFSDSDSTNNYISVYTKSHSDWGTSENDGKLREDKVSWKVKAVDNAGNETSSSRTLFVDRNSPKVELTQINDIPFSSTNFSTNDKTPTIYGKITDSLSGGDLSQTQDENGPKVASGPKQVDIKVEKKEGLGYKLITLYTINIDKPWYSCDNKEVSDNSKQKCDKYLPFEYTSKENLDLGTYKITLTGKDKADNSSSETTLTLNITTLAQITTPEEKKIIEEETKPLKPEEKEKVKEELEITKPVEPSALEKAGEQISQTSKNILTTTGNFISSIFNGIGQGVRFTIDTTGKALAFVGDKVLRPAQDKAGQALAFVGKSTSNTLAALYNGTTSILAYVGQGIGNGAKAVGQGLAFAGEKIGQGVSAVAQGTENLLASISQGIGNTGKAIGDGYSQLANNAPGVAKTILTGIGYGVSTTANFIARATNTVATTTVTIAQNTASAIGNAANSIASTTSSIAQNIASNATTAGKTIANVTNSVIASTTAIARNTGSAIASATQNTTKTVKSGIANVAFAIGEKTQGVAGDFSLALIKFAYNFVPEPTKISDVQVAVLSPTSVKVTWQTNHPANGKVNYGLDKTYPFDIQSEKRVSHHEFTLTSLKPDTLYYFEVMSYNKNYVYDANREFRTPPAK